MSQGGAPEKADDCLFCRIVVGTIPADIVAETDGALAFRDIAPQAPSHVLVVPRRHLADFGELSPADGPLLGEIAGLVQKVAVSEGLAENGYRVVCNVGDDGGNTVAHLHFHLLGGRALTWPPG